ncbi:MAG: hypothetical protein HPY55_04555 [Firmicutes bacterium]|nr:hypothetical protein [Bacillota bacterium]
MRSEILMAGYGGQGIIMAGRVLADALGLHGSMEVTQVSSYGPEARGGMCRTEVIVSDRPIHYTRITRANALLIMSDEAFAKYAPLAGPDSLVLIDSTLVSVPPALSSVRRLNMIPATASAEGIGHRVAANMVMLGALTVLYELVRRDWIEQSLRNTFSGVLAQANLGVFEMGISLARPEGAGGIC